MQGKKISLLGTPTSDSDATTKLYVDEKITTAGVASKLNIDGSNAMTGDLNLGTRSITNVRLITATQISLTSGNSSQFLKGDGSLDEKTYVQQSALTNSAIAYINSSGQLSSSASNLYVQKGVNTIQSALDAVVDNTYSSIQLSSGKFIENVVLGKSNYTLSGLSTRISGDMVLGTTDDPTYLITVRDIIVLGYLEFMTDTGLNYLDHHFKNCEFQGAIAFPAVSTTGSFGITFEDCSFTGSSAITFYNILNPITFTQCTFNGQSITNNLSTANKSNLIFRDCKKLPTLAIPNCLMRGLNESITTGNSFTVNSTSTALLRANGTTDINIYPTMTSGSFAVQWTGGSGGTTQDRTISWRRLSDGISTTVWLTLPVFSVTIGTANSNFGVLCTTATVPANLQVANQPHLPIIVNFNGIIQCGWLHHFGSTFGVQPSNKGAALAGTVCGIPNVAIVSYMV